MDGRDLLIIAIAIGIALAIGAKRLARRPDGRCACGAAIGPGEIECDRCWWERQAP